MGRQGLYEALDRSAVPTRDATRRGAGWRPGLADIGWRNRLGWDEGFHRRIAVNPCGVITGLGVGPARAKDQLLAETFVALRRHPHPACRSVGRPALGPDVCDNGFEGLAAPARWWPCAGAQVRCPPKRHRRPPWSKQARRGLAGGRQRIETVDATGHHTCGRSRERPHALTGFQARLAAKLALHNVWIWLNEPRDRPPLACADLVDWSHGPYLTPSV
jgi:hypothetical protein